MEPVIEIKNLSKRYRIGKKQQYLTLRESVMGVFRHPKLDLISDNDSENFWALRDVSFQVRQGEVLGIIGPNGAGKSTILKILTRITYPTMGEIKLRGKVASLLEVGTGFHQELTGRENIFLNGAVLGMRQAEIRQKFDEIVAFSGIEDFLDTPVKHYSSGMYVRLAFSVAAHLDADILFVDEVLAVGDVEFQKKSLGRMEKITKEGRTVIFVSHNLDAVSRLCNRVLYLDHGKVKVISEKVPDVITSFLKNSHALAAPTVTDRAGHSGNGDVRFSAFRILNKSGQTTDTVEETEQFNILLEARSKYNNLPAYLCVTFFDNNGNAITTSLVSNNSDPVLLKKGVNKFRANVSLNIFTAGIYTVRLMAVSPKSVEYDSVRSAYSFRVAPKVSLPQISAPHPGAVRMEVKWGE